MNITKSDFRMFILTFILGVLIVLQVKMLSLGVKYVPLENIEEMSLSISKEKAEIEQIKINSDYLNDTLELYNKSEIIDDEQVVLSLQNYKRKLETFLNYTDVEGIGIIVIIDDSNRELMQDENPNNLLVHDSDINKIISDLRNAGAEAISVNNQRIIFNYTEVVCVGPTVKINGEHMSPPYIISAIGNRKHLESAMNAPDTTVENLRDWGLFIEVNTSISVKIPKYNNEIFKNYLKIYEEGE